MQLDSMSARARAHSSVEQAQADLLLKALSPTTLRASYLASLSGTTSAPEKPAASTARRKGSVPSVLSAGEPSLATKPAAPHARRVSAATDHTRPHPLPAAARSRPRTSSNSSLRTAVSGESTIAVMGAPHRTVGPPPVPPSLRGGSAESRQQQPERLKREAHDAPSTAI